MTFRESAVQDIRLAMDEAGRESGIRRFTLVGLCSGADNALACAAEDERIDELLLIDAPAYATPQSRRRRLWSRVPPVRGPLDVPRWALRVLRALAGTLLPRGLVRGSHPANESSRKPPPPADFERLMLKLADRGTRMLLVYSGALGERYNSRDQLLEAFPSLAGRIELAYFPDANHVFTELEQRSALLGTLLEWLSPRAAATPTLSVSDSMPARPAGGIRAR